ncbi:MAG: class I SAM-dependent methyltransferase [Anaerolineae bacterium]|nr:class I SAM-dependent methyltransferase [Anaerolineae bacterium]
MSGFLGSFFQLLEDMRSSPAAVVEVGCGEGEILKHLRSRFPAADISATDLSPAVLAQAAQTNPDAGIDFTLQNAEQLDQYSDTQFDLVVCLEVLEHLENPQKGLQELIRISRRDILVSVPNEPIWRILNMLRGKYWKHLGNTPGHLNHWSRTSFRKFLQSQSGAKLVQQKYPFPWQMIWLRKL